MASIYTIKSHSYNTRYMYLTCEQIMDVETNTSTVNWTLNVVGGTANYITTGPTTVKIGGQQVYYAGISYWNVKQFPAAKGSVSGTTTINHNEEGKAAVEVSITTAIYDGVLRTSKGTWTLDDIPRGARITAAPAFTDEDNPKITFTNQAGSSVRACISTDNVNDNICAWRSVSGSEYQFTLTQEEQEKIWDATVQAGSDSITLYYRLETTLGSYIGYHSLPAVCSIKNPDPVMMLTVQAVDDLTLMLTGDPGKIIAGYSEVEYFLDAYGVKNSEITNRYVSIGQYESTSVSGQIQGLNTDTFTYAARDQRNKRVEKTEKLIEVIPYIPVSCSQTSSIKMSGETTARATIKITGNYFNEDFGAEYNQLGLDINYGSGWIAINVAPTFNGNTYEVIYTTPDVPYDQDFVFQIRAFDQLTSATTTEHTLQIIPLFDWSKTDFNFNVPVSFNGQQMNDFIVEQGIETTGSGNYAANWVYRKWNSGVAECWCRKHISTAVNTAWGSLYVSGALPHTNIAWGVDFIDIPVANITIAPNNSGAFLIAGGSTSLTASNTGGYEIARGSALASAGNFYINYYGIGKWR